MTFLEWLESLPGAPSPTTAARRSGLVDATLIRHAAKGETTADNVIAIARAYGVPPIDALVDTGHLRPEEVGGERTPIKMALKAASIGEKWDSIADDIDGMQIIIGRFPRINELDITTVVQAGNRSSNVRDISQHPARDWPNLPRPEHSAADTSDPEPGLGDEGYHDGP